MRKIDNIKKEDISKMDIGFLLWQLEELEHFYPLYKTMIKKEG